MHNICKIMRKRPEAKHEITRSKSCKETNNLKYRDQCLPGPVMDLIKIKKKWTRYFFWWNVTENKISSIPVLELVMELKKVMDLVKIPGQPGIFTRSSTKPEKSVTFTRSSKIPGLPGIFTSYITVTDKPGIFIRSITNHC